MMENSSVFNNPHSPNDNSSGKHFNMEEKSGGGYDNNPAILNIIDEGGENFYNYLKSLGLSKKSNLLVLSSKQHYFYDESDLRDVRTLVNLKRLNLIKNPEKFLHALFRILPDNANFVGCFSDSYLSHPSKMRDRFVSLLDFRTENKLSKDDVSALLEKNGFKIIDMTEMDGLTYFYSQNISEQIGLSA